MFETRVKREVEKETEDSYISREDVVTVPIVGSVLVCQADLMRR